MKDSSAHSREQKKNKQKKKKKKQKSQKVMKTQTLKKKAVALRENLCYDF